MVVTGCNWYGTIHFPSFETPAIYDLDPGGPMLSMTWIPKGDSPHSPHTFSDAWLVLCV